MEGRLSSNLELTSKGVSEKGQQFFVQRWRELLNPLTLDTYALRTMNSHYALKELIEVIELVKSDTIHMANLKPVIDECIYLVRQDIILDKHAKQLKQVLLFNLGSVTTQSKNATMLRMLYHASWVLQRLEKDYLYWCIDTLKEAIGQNELDSINYACSIMATELVQRGWTPRVLHQMGKKLLLKDGTFENRLEEFSGEVKKAKQEYVCLLRLPRSQDLNKLLTAGGFSVVEGKDIKTSFSMPLLDEKISEEYPYLSIPQKAYDAEGAARKVAEEVVRYFNILQFYEFSRQIIPPISSITVVKRPSSAISISLRFPWNEEKETKLAETLFHSALRVISGRLNDSTKDRFHGVFLYSKLAEDSPSQEAAFLNYWVALESLVKIDNYQSNIDHIRSVVPAVLCNRYIYHLIRNFMDDCERCSVNLTQVDSVFTENYSHSRKVKKLIQIMRNPQLAQGLSALCKDYILLEYRCNSFVEMLQNGKTVAEKLKRHHENVSWHLQRLYRIRNAIVHSAYQGNNLIPLVGNLKNYVRQTTQETIMKLDKTSKASIGEAFTFVSDSYESLCDILANENPKQPYDESILVDGPLE